MKIISKSLSLILVLIMTFLYIKHNDRWKFYDTEYSTIDKLGGMFIKDIKDQSLLYEIDSETLYKFYIQYNGQYPLNRLNRILNLIYFYLASDLAIYYWASQTIDQCNFTELSGILFHKLPKDLSQNEIRSILYILRNKIIRLHQDDIKQLNLSDKLLNIKLSFLVKQYYQNKLFILK